MLQTDDDATQQTPSAREETHNGSHLRQLNVPSPPPVVEHPGSPKRHWVVANGRVSVGRELCGAAMVTAALLSHEPQGRVEHEQKGIKGKEPEQTGSINTCTSHRHKHRERGSAVCILFVAEDDSGRGHVRPLESISHVNPGQHSRR